MFCARYQNYIIAHSGILLVPLLKNESPENPSPIFSLFFAKSNKVLGRLLFDCVGLRGKIKKRIYTVICGSRYQKTNHDLVACVFQRFVQLSCFYFEFSLALTVFSFFLIGLDDCCGFGFTTLNQTALSARLK